MITARRAAESLLKMLTGRLAIALVSVVSGVLIPRVLGPESYGRLAAVLAVVAMVQVTSVLGLMSIAVRFLPPLWDQSERGEALVFASTIWTLRLFLSPAAGMVGGLWLGTTVAAGESPAVLLSLGLLCGLKPAFEASRGLLLPIGHVGKFIGFELVASLLRVPVVLWAYLTVGLTGVFLVLPVVHFGMLLWVTATLRRVLPVALRHADLAVLEPYVSYGFSSWLGAVCRILQVNCAIFAVAALVEPAEAGLLAVSLTLFMFARRLLPAALNAVLPALATIESSGNERRLHLWGSLLLSSAVVAYSLGLVLWLALGRVVLSHAFGPRFVSIFPVVTVLFASLIFVAAAQTCQVLLLVRCRAGLALLGTAVFSLAILGGLAAVLPAGGTAVPLRVAYVYLISGALFAVLAYSNLRWLADLRIPVALSGLSAVPALALGVSAAVSSEWVVRPALLVLTLVLYLLIGTGLAFVRRRALTQMVAALKRQSPDGERSAAQVG